MQTPPLRAVGEISCYRQVNGDLRASLESQALSVLFLCRQKEGMCHTMRSTRTCFRLTLIYVAGMRKLSPNLSRPTIRANMGPLWRSPALRETLLLKLKLPATGLQRIDVPRSHLRPRAHDCHTMNELMESQLGPPALVDDAVGIIRTACCFTSLQQIP